MTRFGRVLRRAERRLEAPEPERSRILMEMAADLEDLYRTYRTRGMDESEARRRAEEWLAPSPSTLDSLRSVHVPTFDRLLDRLGGTARGRFELGLVVAVSLLAAAGGVVATLRSEVLPGSSPGLWIVAGLTAHGLALGLRRGYSLFVRGDRLRPGFVRDLRPVLAAAVATALAGLAAGGLRLTLTAAPPGTGAAPAGVWSQVATAAGVAALALSASLVLALLWLLLRIRAEAVRRARARLRESVGAWAEAEPGRREEPDRGAERR